MARIIVDGATTHVAFTYCALNSIGTTTSAVMGWPLRVAGWKVQQRVASIAARSKLRLPLLASIALLSTLPQAPRITHASHRARRPRPGVAQDGQVR